MNIFAVRLKEALTAKNIKPSDLAKKTGIGKSSISDWLAGRYEAKQDKVYRIADALDINEAWLMGQEVPMEKNASTIDRIYKSHRLSICRTTITRTTNASRNSLIPSP